MAKSKGQDARAFGRNWNFAGGRPRFTSWIGGDREQARDDWRKIAARMPRPKKKVTLAPGEGPSRSICLPHRFLPGVPFAGRRERAALDNDVLVAGNSLCSSAA